MNLSNSTYFIVSLLCVIVSVNLEAQVHISTFFDVGENNVSNGIYVKSSFLGSYKFGKTNVSGGSQFNLKYAESNFFSGAFLNVSHEIRIKKFPFEVEGLFLYNPFSDLVHESNLGLLVSIERTHFIYELGTSFRNYRITRTASENYQIESDKNLHENWNLMYLLGYNLKPIESEWNVGIGVTNMDHFLINQETNPMIYLQGKYNINDPLTLFVESWYKSAGSLNISSNYFGYFFRTGLIWNLDLEK